MSKKKALSALRRGKCKTYTFEGEKDEIIEIELRELSYGKMQALIDEQDEDDVDGEEFGAKLLLECLFHDGEQLFEDLDEVQRELDQIGMGTFKQFMDDAIDLHGLKKEGNEQPPEKSKPPRKKRSKRRR